MPIHAEPAFAPSHVPTRSGLDGVVVADTTLSHVDGAAGELVVAGHRVEDLARRATFEDALVLLLTGSLPSTPEREAVRARLGRARAEAFASIDPRDPALAMPDGMDALRALVARAALPAEADPLETTLRLAAAVGVAVGAWHAHLVGRPAVAPEPSLGHAADLLRMARGAEADGHEDAARVAALDRYLVTVMDHGMNASTFAARVVASTGSDAVSAIVAAIGALKGPLHGGAPGPVLDMLDAIGAPPRARPWLEAELAAGRRIMGMGHRIYRVRDPRAAVLEEGIEHLQRAQPSERLALARAVEREAQALLAARHPERPLRANVEFFTAVLLEAVGLDRRGFAPTFAAGRVVGWCAHVAEQRRTGRLIRPASRYVGPMPSDTSAVSDARAERRAGS
ncbi:MAG: citrate synthase/methylcitrate synthase [Sandaracinaceae bacterium]